MGQSEKAALYNELKAAGVEFKQHYRHYTEAQLEAAVAELRAGQAAAAGQPEAVAEVPALPQPQPEQPPVTPNDGYGEQPPADFFGFGDGAEGHFEDVAPQVPQPEQVAAVPPPNATPHPLQGDGILRTIGGEYDLRRVPVRERDPNELAAQRQNQGGPDMPVRIDPVTGHIWFQEEIRKPAMPKARARRVVDYTDPGVKEQAFVGRDFSERFEVAGDGQGVPAQVKVTLPSYQVGIFQDPRMPFKTHVYNEQQGFDLFEVQAFYGGPEMVPPEIKRIYVSNVLCYDIRTTVRAISDEYRQRVLTGAIKE